MKIANATIIDRAENLEQLLAQLATTSIAIPETHGRQRKDAVERWAACRLLAALPYGNRLAFPLSMQQRDKPDFVIYAGAVNIGLEATIAMSSNYAKCVVLRDEEYPDTLIDMGLFRRGAPELSKDQMREILASGRLSSPPFAGDSMERDWAASIDDRVADKLAKIRSPGFNRHDENWLIIHDNLPMPSYGLDLGVELLMPLLEARASGGITFDEIFIEHTDTMVCIRKNEATSLQIPDLWKSITPPAIEARA